MPAVVSLLIVDLFCNKSLKSVVKVFFFICLIILREFVFQFSEDMLRYNIGKLFRFTWVG